MRHPLRRALRHLALLALSSALATGAAAEPIAPAAIRVIDGDTIAVGRVHYRLVGFDAPEIRHARCASEHSLGLSARDRLRALVSAGGLDLTEVACTCPAKTLGTRLCNYGRRCGTLTAGGRDVGDILTAEGLAHPYPYAHHPARAPGWCNTEI